MESHNYHYIRYGALFAFVAVLTQMPALIQSGLPPATLRAFGILLAVLCITIDWRNYQLWKQEEKRTGIGPITVAIALFYFGVLGWFVMSPTLARAHRPEIDEIQAIQRQVTTQLHQLVTSNHAYGAKLAALDQQLNVLIRGQHLQEKLEELDRMRGKNLITAGEYNSKKAEILARF